MVTRSKDNPQDGPPQAISSRRIHSVRNPGYSIEIHPGFGALNPGHGIETQAAVHRNPGRWVWISLQLC